MASRTRLRSSPRAAPKRSPSVSGIRKENGDALGRDPYPEVLKSLAKVVEGTPEVENYEVCNSTFHKIAARS
jgi:hypothetical protein